MVGGLTIVCIPGIGGAQAVRKEEMQVAGVEAALEIQELDSEVGVGLKLFKC